MGQQLCKDDHSTADTLIDRQTNPPHPSVQMHGDHHESASNSSKQPNSTNKEQKKETYKDPNFSYPTLAFASQENSSEFRPSKMIIMDGQRVSQKVLHEVMSIPFEVAILTTTKKFRSALTSVGKKLYKKYAKGEFEKEWKLHRNGYFVNYVGAPVVAVMTQSTLYEGKLQQQSQGILPCVKGRLLSERGLYTGEFEHGKAHGKGIFTQSKTKNKFEGTWEQGVLAEGSINSKELKFTGGFVGGEAGGQGELEFKHKNISYKGNFKGGKYYSESAKYESKAYLYEGSFKFGKKQGGGKLLEKQPDYKDLSTTYRVPQIFSGIWQEDYYLGRTKEEVTLVDTEQMRRQIEGEEKKEVERKQREDLLKSKVGGDYLEFKEVLSQKTQSESGSSQQF